MTKSITLTLLLVGIVHLSNAQSTKPATTQPTPSMQEQYDKLHGNTPKKTTTPAKSKTTDTKRQTTEKTQKAAPSPKPQVAAASNDKGGFKFKVGLKGGANYSTTSATTATPNVKLESILGYHGGLIFSLGGERFSVQPEVLYAQIGSKASGTLGQVNISGETIMNTVTVPILLKLSLGGPQFSFFVNGGGYGSYALDGNYNITSPSGTTNQKIEFVDNKGRIEYGAVGGAGISLGIGRALLLVEGRYYYGLGNNTGIIKENQTFYRNIQGSIGILFPLGGR